jgi:hypothetical protein
MNQDQIILLLDLKASKDRGAASMSCDQRRTIVDGMVKLQMVERYGYGYRITSSGEKWLLKNRNKK